MERGGERQRGRLPTSGQLVPKSPSRIFTLVFIRPPFRFWSSKRGQKKSMAK